MSFMCVCVCACTAMCIILFWCIYRFVFCRSVVYTQFLVLASPASRNFEGLEFKEHGVCWQDRRSFGASPMAVPVPCLVAPDVEAAAALP